MMKTPLFLPEIVTIVGVLSVAYSSFFSFQKVTIFYYCILTFRFYQTIYYWNTH